MSWHIRKFSFISVRWKKKKNLLADIFNKNVWVCSCSLFFLANIAASREAAWALAFRPFSKATLLYRFLFFCLFRNKNGRLPFTFFETEDVLKMIRCWLRKLIFEQGFKLELGWSCWNSGDVWLHIFFQRYSNVWGWLPSTLSPHPFLLYSLFGPTGGRRPENQVQRAWTKFNVLAPPQDPLRCSSLAQERKSHSWMSGHRVWHQRRRQDCRTKETEFKIDTALLSLTKSAIIGGFYSKVFYA